MVKNPNFFKLMIGSFISAIGSLGVNFLLSLYIFDRTKSINHLILFNILMLIPGIFIPILVGPIVDKKNKKNLIILLDIIQFFIFLIITLFSLKLKFNYIYFLALGIVNISINIFYNITFYAFIPEIVEKEELQRVYSITSMMDPFIKIFIIPLSVFLYTNYGIWIIFFINSITYIIAVCIEKYITYEYINVENERKNKNILKKLMENTKETIIYLKKEKGIKNIYLYFMLGMFGYSSISNLLYPYFETHKQFDIQDYSTIMTASAIGLIVGGILHYFIKISAKYKYIIAVLVYFMINSINAVLVYLPFELMVISYFIYGILSINSYNIRQTTTQVYIPSSIRGRINGVFTIFNSFAMIIGGLLCMILVNYLSISFIIFLFSSFGILGAFKFILFGKKDVEKIYNL